MKGRVIIEVSGGVVQDHTLINCAVDVHTLDWDDFEAQPVQTYASWPHWMQEHFKTAYPDEYSKVKEA